MTTTMTIYSTTHLKRQSHNAHNKSMTQKSFDTYLATTTIDTLQNNRMFQNDQNPWVKLHGHKPNLLQEYFLFHLIFGTCA